MKRNYNGTSKVIEYVLRLDGTVIKYFSTAPLTFTDPVSTTEITLSRGVLQLPKSLIQSIDVQNCTLSTKSINVTLLNGQGDATSTVSEILYESLNESIDNIYMKDAYLFEVVDGVSEVIFKGFTRNVTEKDPYGVEFTVELVDLQEKLRESIWFDYLSNDFTPTKSLPAEFDQETRNEYKGKSYTAYNTTEMIALSGIELNDTCYVTSNAEYYKNTGNYNGDIGYWQKTEEPESLKCITFEGKPVDFAKGLFKFIFGDPGYLDFIVEADFLQANYDVSKDVNLYFEFFDELENPIDFLSENIFRLLNAYPTITKSGKLALINQKQPTETEIELNSITIDDSNIIKISSNKNNFNEIVNQVLFSYKYNWRKEQFLRKEYFLDEDSYSKYSRLLPKKPKILEVIGDSLLNSSERENLILGIKNELFNRYNFYTKTFKMTVFKSKDNIEVGSYVVLESDKLIDWKGSTEGLRGIAGGTTGENLIINSGDNWGDYIGSDTDSDIGEVDGYQVIKVDREVKTQFFNEDNKELRYQQRKTKLALPARFYAALDSNKPYGN